MRKLELVKLPLGLLKFAWLKALKNSARTGSGTFSRIFVFLPVDRGAAGERPVAA